MKIDGSQIVSGLKKELAQKVVFLRRRNITPHLAVILIDNDPSSLAYIRQKEKMASELGVKFSNYQIAGSLNSKKELINLIHKLNKDKTVHGIIIQRPVPIDISRRELNKLVIPKKDIDGFHPKSPFTPPVAKALLVILEWVFKSKRAIYKKTFLSWLKKQKILIIGRGETGGKPIAKTFKKMGIPYSVAHSQTKNLNELCLKADIIISCVGKPNIVRHNMVANKTTVIGVGLHLEKGKLQPDYNQKKIGEKAEYYTPVPKGVGPVNVACLFENLLKAV